MNDAADEPITQINVTPLVDVSLVLVIIFMAVAPFVLQAGLKASPSEAGAALGRRAMAQNVSLAVDASGRVMINGKPVAAENLAGALKKALTASRDRLVAVSAEPSLKVETVVSLLDLSRQMGARKLVVVRSRAPGGRVNHANYGR
ncbi:MAG: biopolymer transporter ExbD [Elusimicrobia bacterium]|nr:biopolymer transporter ExbD [Elusimicrobiota bacterium]